MEFFIQVGLQLKWVLGQNKFKSKWTSSQNKFRLKQVRVKMGFLSKTCLGF